MLEQCLVRSGPLMGSGSGILFLLLKPVLLWYCCAALGRTLNLDSLCLVRLQFARNVGLFGGCGGRGDLECLDIALGVRSLDWWDLVGLELAKVQLLDEIGWSNWVSTVAWRAIGMNHLSERPWE